MLIEEDTPIRIEDVEGLRLDDQRAPTSRPHRGQTWTSRPQTPAEGQARQGARDRERDGVAQRRRPAPCAGWSTSSVHDDVPGMRRSLDILRNAGWGKTSERIGRRLEAALKSQHSAPR